MIYEWTRERGFQFHDIIVTYIAITISNERKNADERLINVLHSGDESNPWKFNL